MKLLLDTHVVIAVVRATVEAAAIERLPAAVREQLNDAGNDLIVSSASLWEIAIKHRLGKLDVGVPPRELPRVCAAIVTELIGITPEHAIAELDPAPATRDPFDRLLLAPAEVEGARLLTIDRALVDHPIAWRPAAP